MLLERLDVLFQFLANYPQFHARESNFYRFVESVTTCAFQEAKPLFMAGQKVSIGEIGPIDLPYEQMGAIDSMDLFGLDELLMFAYYFRNRGRYARAADIGANIGLHSIVLAKCGVEVESYEPDPKHFAKLVRNVKSNGVFNNLPHQAAVSERSGTMEFVRVLGNTTSSHLAGAKANPYGELERFDVEVHDIREIAKRVNLMKIDAEGHEAVILRALPREAWQSVDAFVEVGSPENASTIFQHFANSNTNLFSQKQGWTRVRQLEDMPKSYRDGGIFITSSQLMTW